MSKFPPLHELEELVDILYAETERGCVVMGAAVIDDCLARVLRLEIKKRSDLNSEERRDLLKSPLGALGSFSQRTRIAQAMGIIDRTLADALDAIRNVRNKAAHLGKKFALEKYESALGGLFSPLSKSEKLLSVFMGLLDGPRSEKIKSAKDLKADDFGLLGVFRIQVLLIYFRLLEKAFDFKGSRSAAIDECWSAIQEASKELQEKSKSSDVDNSAAQM